MSLLRVVQPLLASLSCLTNMSPKKFRAFWDVAPCSHVEVDRRFRGAYCFYHQGPDDGSSPRFVLF
jgi:hypothetical protein